MEKKTISIISAVHNEEQNLVMFYERIVKTLDSISNHYDFELLFTNNCSTDKTYEIICDLHKRDKRVNILTFSRNFGYQPSILAGLTFSRGEASIVIDVDCEDPPELIPTFVEKWEEGYDVVYGIRKKRQENVIVQRMRLVFYWLLQKMGDYEVIRNMSEFALITREVRDAILDNKSTFPFLRTEIGYAGFRRFGIDYIRQARQFGKTHYKFWNMTAFAIGGILSSSTVLLRLSAFVGMILLPVNLILLLFEFLGLFAKAFELFVMLDLMYLVFFLATLSIYNARMFKNIAQRPVFIVDWKHSTIKKPSSGGTSS
jgi:dolichol-phosphate mannosyltransferase